MVSDGEKMLPLRKEFDQAWHGFDRNQIREYLDTVEAQLKRSLSDRDAARSRVTNLASELAAARTEIQNLTGRVNELLHPPERMEDLDERMQRVVQIANMQAEEITAAARVAAEKQWQDTTQAGKALRERYEKLLSALEKHADTLQSEHENVLATTQAEVAELTDHAAQRRATLDAEAEAKRRLVEQQFDETIAAQRAAAEKEIADLVAASKQEAKQRVDEATATAKKLVDDATTDSTRRIDEATKQVARLAEIRDQAAERLKTAEEALARGKSALAPLEGEKTINTEPVGQEPQVEKTAKTESESGNRVATTIGS